jgi:hypothetical protein
VGEKEWLFISKIKNVPQKILYNHITMEDIKGFIPLHGGYRNLHSFQKAEIIYDGDNYFCNRFFHKYDKTDSQMFQAARPGKQNIVEGSMASGTSKEMELKLTNVARASLEALLIDYEDSLKLENCRNGKRIIGWGNGERIQSYTKCKLLNV